MSRTSRVITGAAIGYIQLGLATVVGLWFTPFLLRHIGQRDFGLWSAGLPILTYVGFVDFGVLVLLSRDVAFALGSAGGDVTKAKGLAATVGRTTRLVLFQTPILCVAAFIAWRSAPANWAALRWPLAIVLASAVLNFPFRIKHAVLVGLQDVAFIGRLGLVSWAVGVLVNVVLIVRGWGLYALAVSWSVGQGISSAACYLRVNLAFRPTVPTTTPSISRAYVRGQFRSGFWVIIGQLGVLLFGATDVMVVAAVLGPAAVTPYTITDKLVTMVTTIPLVMLSTAQAALTELNAGQDRRRLGEVSSTLTLAVLVVSGLLASVLLTVDQGFVYVWVSAEQFAGKSVLLLLVASMVLYHWTAATAYTLFAFGRERRLALANAANGLVSVLGMFVGARYFGLAGAAFGSVVGFATVGIPPNVVALAAETETSVWQLLRPLVPWAWRFAAIAVASIALGRYYVPTSLVMLIATSIATGVLYVVLMTPVVLQDPLGKYVRPRIRSLWVRVARR